MDLKLSIIVPIYNTQKYLSKCIDSLLNQGLKLEEYEIILVNDGSTDESLSICERYQAQYSNIMIINQENQGVSLARNAGIEAAKGNYICFVDSDDFINSHSLSYLFSNFNVKQYDLIRYWNKISLENDNVPSQLIKGEINYEGSGHDFVKIYGLDTFCCIFLYRTDFIKCNNIKFFPYSIGEDFLFVSSVELANPRMLSTSCVVYQYIIHDNTSSTIRTRECSRRCVQDLMAVNDDVLSLLKDYHIKEEDEKLFIKSMEQLEKRMPHLFSRMLTADLTYMEFKSLVKKCHNQGLLPIKMCEFSLKTIGSFVLVNVLYMFNSLYKPISYLYRSIFVSYVLPRVNRDLK